MSIVTIKLNNKQFQLACDDGEEDQLNNLAERLDSVLMETKSVNPSASFELLLVMSSLKLQDRISTLEQRISEAGGNTGNEKEEQFAETLTTIAGYLENLAQKLGK